jgi:hypothetical protein
MGQDKNRVFVSYVRDNSDDVNRIREAFLKNGKTRGTSYIVPVKRKSKKKIKSF